MNKPDISGFLTSNAFLSTVIKYNGLSIRDFAKLIECSPAYTHSIVSHGGHLSINVAQRVKRLLKMDEKEGFYLNCLAITEKSRLVIREKHMLIYIIKDSLFMETKNNKEKDVVRHEIEGNIIEKVVNKRKKVKKVVRDQVREDKDRA